MTVLSAAAIEKLLAEDVPYGDLTADALGIGDFRGRIRFAARAAMMVAAIEEAQALFAAAGVAARIEAPSGQAVAAGAPLLTGEGTASGVLRAWKVAQTLVEIWSGVATATAKLVEAARTVRPGIVVACTRKNVPGTKALAIAAVKAGGGAMHRLGLSETVLVFPEHRAFRPGDDLSVLARDLKARLPEKKLVVEANTVAEGVAAAAAGRHPGREILARHHRPTSRAPRHDAPAPRARRCRRRQSGQRRCLCARGRRRARHLLALYGAARRRRGHDHARRLSG